MSAERPELAPPPAAPHLDEGTVEAVLTRGALELEGRLALASNASFLGQVSLDGITLSCIYKPVSGERPLWDFPTGSLAGRERAARVVSEAAGWCVVPPTVLRDGRFGEGMLQQWIEVDPDVVLVDVVDAEFDEPAWIAVLEAEDALGRPLVLVHADDDRLRDLAVLDAVINNADRKGGHVLPDAVGRVWGCDHGVTFHEDNKLRTVLWGWADDPIREPDTEALQRLDRALDDGTTGRELHILLAPTEISALRRRIRGLLRRRVMPSPAGTWPSIPWPAI